MYLLPKITPYINPSGAPRFRVVARSEDREVRRNFNTRAKAERFLADIQGATPSQGTTGAVSAAMNLNADDKHHLLRLIKSLVTEEIPSPSTTVVSSGSQVCVRTAVTDFLSVKTKRRLRDRSLAEYRSRLGPLKKTFGDKPVAELTADLLTPLIHREGLSARTVNSNRRVLFGFFKWCRKRKLLLSNPVEEIELVQVDQSTPQIFSVDEVQGLLRAAKKFKRGVMLPYLSLGFFAGLRPKELSRLKWGTHISPLRKVIEVSADIAKMRSRRVIEFSENLAAWVAAIDGKKVTGKNWRRNLDSVRRLAGFKASYPRKKDRGLKDWPADGVRHTALSMHFAAHQDEKKTAYWAGNSPDVMHRHYKGLVSEAEALAYWRLLPDDL